MEIGKKYEITTFGKGKGGKGTKFKGMFIAEEKEFYILQHREGFKECFLKSDFVTGECKVEEA
jgi:hypothetical protein